MQEPAAQPDPEQTLAELERRLKATPRSARPLEHAALRYSIGLTYAELPTGDRQMNMSRAVASYRQAAALFGPHRFPVEHARVQNALGAALRELGSPSEAKAACQRAVELLAGGRAPGELAAALNNLGLARSDLGEHEEAVQALEQAVEVFAAAGEPRQYVMALHNLGQAQASAGDHSGAVDTYARALADLDVQQLPYQWGLVQHALGVALTAIGQPDRATDAFASALRVFTRQHYPFQYALAKNNYGLAWAQIGGVTALRRAVSAYEDAIRVIDVRLHRAQWEQIYRNLEMAEQALEELGHPASRTTHFAALVAEVDDDEREPLLRERLTEVLSMPDTSRDKALAEFDRAVVSLPEEAGRRTTATWLNVLMELPNELLVAGLGSRIAVHRSLPSEEERIAADRLLDDTVQDELLAPQRMKVRDTLRMMGWERP